MRLGVSAALVEGELLPGDVEVASGVVTGLGLERVPGAAGIACPGFVDLHVNGFAGVDLQTADADGFRRAGEALLRGGVTAYRPTFVTAPEEQLVASLRSLPGRTTAARVIGAHLEGPFIAASRLGAHDPAGRRDPDLALLERLLAAGPVRQVTLAPELPGALELIDALCARGVTVACGHSDATPEQARRAFDRGARTVTHLFNAMPKQGGLAEAALARDDVTVQLIADGHHVAPELIRLAWRSAAGRLGEAPPGSSRTRGAAAAEARQRIGDARRRRPPAQPRRAARGRADRGDRGARLDRGHATARPAGGRPARRRDRARRPARGGARAARALSLSSGEEGELVEVDRLVAGAAVAVPTAQEGLQEQHRLRECQAGRGAFGHSRSSVRKACAQVTSAQWWWKPR